MLWAPTATSVALGLTTAMLDALADFIVELFQRQAERLQAPRLVAVLLLSIPGLVCAQSNGVQDNVVLRWNQAALDAIVISRTAPVIAARALAIMHTCMYDSWVAYDDNARSAMSAVSPRRPSAERTAANRERAISFAAYRALADLFQGQKATLLDPLMSELGMDASDSSVDITTPSGVGNASCAAVLASRHNDGSNQLGDKHSGAYSDYTGYTPANRAGILRDPNRWQPLIIGGVSQSWQLPHWGLVTPFALTSGSQFRSRIFSGAPYLYPSEAYWKQAFDVVELSARLGDNEKVIAEFWADGAGTVTPPGHWNAIAQAVSRRDHYSEEQDVKLFFVLNNALLDAGIAAWDAKRFADSIRPVTVIRSLMGNRRIRAWAGPGLGIGFIECKDFRSFLPTPAFAGFVSGHSAFSAAAAEVLKRFTGSDDFGQSITVAPGSSLIEPGLTPAVPVTLHWTTFTEAADQAGMSRRYAGIHFETDDVAGRALGRLAAGEVWKKSMTYVELK